MCLIGTFAQSLLQAVCAQLKRHPVLNAAVAGNDVILRKPINLGIAVALEPTGLIVPVLKHADELSLTGLTRGTNDLAARARSKKNTPTHCCAQRASGSKELKVNESPRLRPVPAAAAADRCDADPI